MKIGGFQKFSMIDYPGYVSAVVFAQGCNFRCPFCHNYSLVLPQYYNQCIPEQNIFDYLQKRLKLIDAVVLTGGEPTVQGGIFKFLNHLRQLPFKIKLDTNGANPKILQKILRDKLVDFIAMDIKAPINEYQKFCGVQVNEVNISASIKLIVESKIDSQFRTTLTPQLSEKSIDEITNWMQKLGVTHTFQQYNSNCILQNFRI